jgi:hypothetical protein
MSALRRLLFLMIAAGVAGVWLRRQLEPAPPSLPQVLGDEEVAVASKLGPVTDEMNAIPLPLEEELAFVEEAEPEVMADEEQDTAEVDIVSVVDDLIEPETPEDQQ